MTLSELNGLARERAVEELMRCCGCAAWAASMERRRPFASKEALLAAADEEWARAEPEHWIEAFSHHPRIGGKDALRARFAATASWSQGEQSQVAEADEATLDALAAGNAEYESKFGHIFIVCAAGKSAQEMLRLLRGRLPNDPAFEKRVAAAEQGKITKIRLEKLLS